MRYVLVLSLALMTLAACQRSGYFVDDVLFDANDFTPPPLPTPTPGDNNEFHIVLEDLANVPMFLPDPRTATLWVRIPGGGYETQYERTVRAAVFDLGENGVWDNGTFDDEPVWLPRNIGWSITEWVAVDDLSDDPPTIDSKGIFTAGATTGTATVEADGGVWGTASQPVIVVPPDWCPGEVDCAK
jgi:hypothetical protein